MRGLYQDGAQSILTHCRASSLIADDDKPCFRCFSKDLTECGHPRFRAFTEHLLLMEEDEILWSAFGIDPDITVCGKTHLTCLKLMYSFFSALCVKLSESQYL